MDFLIVAMVVNQSLEVFTSQWGTWIPSVLILVSTWVTGLLVMGRSAPRIAG
jgi:hypothetical protein